MNPKPAFHTLLHREEARRSPRRRIRACRRLSWRTVRSAG